MYGFMCVYLPSIRTYEYLCMCVFVCVPIGYIQIYVRSCACVRLEYIKSMSVCLRACMCVVSESHVFVKLLKANVGNFRDHQSDRLEKELRSKH